MSSWITSMNILTMIIIFTIILISPDLHYCQDRSTHIGTITSHRNTRMLIFQTHIIGTSTKPYSHSAVLFSLIPPHLLHRKPQELGNRLVIFLLPYQASQLPS